jgi:hypothetical protein
VAIVGELLAVSAAPSMHCDHEHSVHQQPRVTRGQIVDELLAVSAASNMHCDYMSICMYRQPPRIRPYAILRRHRHDIDRR